MVSKRYFSVLPLLAACIGFSDLATSNEVILPASAYCDDGTQVPQRRRPGVSVDEYKLPPCNDETKQNGVVPWVDPVEFGPPIPDRWRIVEAIGITTNLWDPYSGHNPLKGDFPVWGKDWFYSMIGVSDTIIEPRRFPIPVGNATSTRSGSLDTIGAGKTVILASNLILENVIYKGNTVFRPPDWEFRFTPVFNINEVHADEKGILNVDPDKGGSSGRKRRDYFMGVQALFIDKHLRNVSDRYDFDSLRVGIQPFSSDFRGFLFQDSQFGVRLFGTRNNNIFQYNLAWFRRLEKDSNSGLNDLTQSIRDDDVYIANVYWQDFPRLGFISQATVLHNVNREKGKVKYDKNGFIARPSSLFEERFARNYEVTYLGYSGDGHFGRFNLATSTYFAIGNQTSSRLRSTNEDIKAFFFAAEGSMDFDWFRPKLSILFASGDDDPFDRTANGFDAIFENPQFAGGDTSFVIRQNIPFIGGGGVANWNYFRFDKTEVLEALRQQGNIDKELGHDVSMSLIWRPFMSQNLVVRLSAAGLIGGEGFDDLYGNEADMPYSLLANIVLMY